jgi:Adenosine-deaminase (editase) domain
LDRTIIATAHGSTAFEAKSKVADRAMIVLSNRTKQIEMNSCKLNEISPTASSIFDQHCQLVRDFIQSKKNDPIASAIFKTLKNRFYAAFILKKGHWERLENVSIGYFFSGQNDPGKVIAFGVGSRCSSPDNIDDDGCALLDCHGLVMARRALLQ